VNAHPCWECASTNGLTRLPHGRICVGCRRRRHYHPETCPRCELVRPLAWLRDDVVVCASCAGVESIFACIECGREDHPYGLNRCARCFLRERPACILETRRVVHHEPSGLELRGRLRQLKLDALELGQRFAELRPLAHVVHGRIQRAPRDADHLRADANAPFVQRFDRNLVPLPNGAEDVRRRHDASIEDELSGARGANA